VKVLTLPTFGATLPMVWPDWNVHPPIEFGTFVGDQE